MNIANSFAAKIAGIFEKETTKNNIDKIAIAVSGGSDSLALTLLLSEFCKKKKIKIFAITVNHQMRKNSAIEAKELTKILAAKKIPHQILTIPQSKIPKSNIEAKLREMRYELLYDFCQKNQIQYLFLGHILGDVAENFLIRLFRGSGLDGLSAMAEISNYKNIKLVRPLLDFAKEDGQEFLKKKKIKWFEDESNLDEKFLRNKIRNFFNSFDEKNLIHKRIKNAADEISKMRDFFDEILLKEAKKIVQLKKEKSGFYFLIKQKEFQKLDEKIALKILAFILMEISEKPYKPRLEKLKNFYNHLLQEQFKKRNFYGAFAIKFDKNHIKIFAEKANQKNQNLTTILRGVF